MHIQRLSLIVVVISSFAPSLFAQTAGGGADSNRQDRQAAVRQAELNRLMQYDKPVYKDPLGNALIGSPTTGLIRGAANGATSILSGTAIGAAAHQHGKK